MELIGVRFQRETIRRIDALRGDKSRSAFIRQAVDISILSINGYKHDKVSLVRKADKALKDIGL